MTKRNCVVHTVVFRLINQLLYLINLLLVQTTDKVKWSLGARLQAGIDRNKRISFRSDSNVIHVRSWMFLPLNGIIGIIIIVCLEINHVEIICKTIRIFINLSQYDIFNIIFVN